MRGWLEVSDTSAWLDVGNMRVWLEVTDMSAWLDVGNMRGWLERSDTSACTWAIWGWLEVRNTSASPEVDDMRDWLEVNDTNSWSKLDEVDGCGIYYKTAGLNSSFSFPTIKPNFSLIPSCVQRSCNVWYVIKTENKIVGQSDSWLVTRFPASTCDHGWLLCSYVSAGETDTSCHCRFKKNLEPVGVLSVGGNQAVVVQGRSGSTALAATTISNSLTQPSDTVPLSSYKVKLILWRKVMWL